MVTPGAGTSERPDQPRAAAAVSALVVVAATVAGAVVVAVLVVAAAAGAASGRRRGRRRRGVRGRTVVDPSSTGVAPRRPGAPRPPVQRGSFACSASSQGPDTSSPRCGSIDARVGHRDARAARVVRVLGLVARAGHVLTALAAPVLRGGGPVLGRGGAGPRSFRSFRSCPRQVVAPPRLDEPEVSTAATTTAASTPTSTTVNRPVIAFFIPNSLGRLRGTRMRKARTATVQGRVRSW